MTKRITQSWDKITRSVHWLIAILFLTNYFYTEPGYEAHVRVGRTIFGLVILRIVWGFTLAKGPNRINNFYPNIQTAKEHINEIKTRKPPEKVGHNAFGSCAIFLMWFGLLSAAFTGWLQDTDWGFDNDVADWHEFIVEALWILVVIHILAVILTSIWLRRNLIKQMIFGN